MRNVHPAFRNLLTCISGRSTTTLDPKFELIAPTFYRLAVSGLIYERDGSWLGAASDGQEVSFGCSIPSIERYLKANPTPDKW